MRSYPESMRLRKALVTVSLVLVAKAVLIGWVAWGRAELIGRPPHFGAGAVLVTGLIGVGLVVLVVTALRVRASAAGGTRR